MNLSKRLKTTLVVAALLVAGGIGFLLGGSTISASAASRPQTREDNGSLTLFNQKNDEKSAEPELGTVLKGLTYEDNWSAGQDWQVIDQLQAYGAKEVDAHGIADIVLQSTRSKHGDTMLWITFRGQEYFLPAYNSQISADARLQQVIVTLAKTRLNEFRQELDRKIAMPVKDAAKP